MSSYVINFNLVKGLYTENITKPVLIAGYPKSNHRFSFDLVSFKPSDAIQKKFASRFKELSDAFYQTTGDKREDIRTEFEDFVYVSEYDVVFAISYHDIEGGVSTYTESFTIDYGNDEFYLVWITKSDGAAAIDFNPMSFLVDNFAFLKNTLNDSTVFYNIEYDIMLITEEWHEKFLVDKEGVYDESLFLLDGNTLTIQTTSELFGYATINDYVGLLSKMLAKYKIPNEIVRYGDETVIKLRLIENL